MTTLMIELEVAKCPPELGKQEFKLKQNKLGRTYNIDDLVGRNEEAYRLESSDSDTDETMIPTAHGLLIEQSITIDPNCLTDVCQNFDRFKIQYVYTIFRFIFDISTTNDLQMYLSVVI